MSDNIPDLPNHPSSQKFDVKFCNQGELSLDDHYHPHDDSLKIFHFYRLLK